MENICNQILANISHCVFDLNVKHFEIIVFHCHIKQITEYFVNKTILFVFNIYENVHFYFFLNFLSRKY